MCTVSWLREPLGYRVWFNRDERQERAAALPPAVQPGDIPWVAAMDPEGGGTWLGVNFEGLTVALLNHYPAEILAQVGNRSRGLLVRDLVNVCAQVADVADALGRLPMGAYRAFHLLAWDETTEGMWTWDGENLHALNPNAIVPPITTSSYASAAVVAHRQALFTALPQPRDAASHLAYHQHHEPHQPAFGVLMERTDARTVGLAEVEVTHGQIRYCWTPRQSQRGGWEETQSICLDRRLS